METISKQECSPHRRACGEAEIRRQIPEWLKKHGYSPGTGYELQVCVKCFDVKRVQLYQAGPEDARIEQVIQRITTKPHAAIYDGQYEAASANGNSAPTPPTTVAAISAPDDDDDGEHAGDSVSANLTTLKPRQFQALTLLLEGYNISEVSKQTGALRETISDWLKSPDFRDALAAARQSVIDVVVARLTQASNKAVSTLVEILDDPDEDVKVKLQAASQVLALTYRFAVEGPRPGQQPGRKGNNNGLVTLQKDRDELTGKWR